MKWNKVQKKVNKVQKKVNYSIKYPYTVLINLIATLSWNLCLNFRTWIQMTHNKINQLKESEKENQNCSNKLKNLSLILMTYQILPLRTYNTQIHQYQNLRKRIPWSSNKKIQKPLILFSSMKTQKFVKNLMGKEVVELRRTKMLKRIRNLIESFSKNILSFHLIVILQ